MSIWWYTRRDSDRNRDNGVRHEPQVMVNRIKRYMDLNRIQFDRYGREVVGTVRW
jgi:hypothetical protein